MASCIALKSEGTVPLTIESKGVRVPPIPLKNYAYGCGVRRRERNDATALQAINLWNYVAARVCRLAAGPVEACYRLYVEDSGDHSVVETGRWRWHAGSNAYTCRHIPSIW